MTIDLLATLDAPNVLNKNIVPVSTLTGTVKDNTDLLNPVILINADAIPTSNYCKIHEFGRWYFITDITIVSAHLFAIHCAVDVLQSFKNDVLNASIIARRSSSWYDPYLPDEYAKNRTDTEITYRRLGGFSFNPSGGSYVLQTVGANPVT